MENKRIPSKATREVCGGISDMTLWRWLNDPALNFPKPIYIGRRRYWKEADVLAWLEAKKVRTRAAASTAAENVEAIAAYYGKTVSAFMRCEDAEGDDFTALLDLLTEPEKKMLAAQIRAMVSMRGQK